MRPEVNKAPFAAALAVATLLCVGAASAHDPKAPSATASTSTTASDPEVRKAAEAVDAFHAALSRGDTQAAASLLVDEALIFEHGRAERSRAEYAGHHLPGDATYAAATRHEVTRRNGRVAGDLAYVVSEGRTTGRYRDRDIDQITVETMVLQRTTAGWKIAHVHWSSRAAK
jgi:ketosteroid isomerase-like protein